MTGLSIDSGRSGPEISTMSKNLKASRRIRKQLVLSTVLHHPALTVHGLEAEHRPDCSVLGNIIIT